MRPTSISRGRGWRRRGVFHDYYRISTPTHLSESKTCGVRFFNSPACASNMCGLGPWSLHDREPAASSRQVISAESDTSSSPGATRSPRSLLASCSLRGSKVLCRTFSKYGSCTEWMSGSALSLANRRRQRGVRRATETSWDHQGVL